MESGTTEAKIKTDVPFYFGNGFARVWWEDLKSAHVKEEDLELDALIDKALADVDPSANRRYIDRMRQGLQDRGSGKEDKSPAAFGR